MNLLYAAAAFLVGGGASLALALLWLRVGVRRRRRVLDDLLALRGRFEADPLLALEQAAHWIRTAGLRGLAWRGEWYGVQVAGSAGQPPAPVDLLAGVVRATQNLQRAASIENVSYTPATGALAHPEALPRAELHGGGGATCTDPEELAPAAAGAAG